MCWNVDFRPDGRLFPLSARGDSITKTLTVCALAGMFLLAQAGLGSRARGQGLADSVYNLYVGNLHSHTSYSDGSGTPAQAFEYARDVASIDFLAITDHHHVLTAE